MMDRGGLTKAGRALDKHGNRPASMFPKVKGGPNSKSIQGQHCLDDILTNPSGIIETSNRPRYGGEVFDIKMPGGQGVRYTKMENLLVF